MSARNGTIGISRWIAGALAAFAVSAGTAAAGELSTATFAGGCFWCMQPPFDKMEGVVSTEVGYAGGPEKNPSYKQVSAGRTGHAEAVRVIFDTGRVSYGELLDVFWRQIDPTDPGGQFADRGRQYRTAIFVHGGEQRRKAEESKKALESSGRFGGRIVTEITDAGAFYPAEDDHQKYYVKNPAHYKSYRIGSGREGFLKRVWADEDAPVKQQR